MDRIGAIYLAHTFIKEKNTLETTQCNLEINYILFFLKMGDYFISKIVAATASPSSWVFSLTV